MFPYLSLLICFASTQANHFNGGTITWKPVNALDNSSSVTIIIEQSYWWTYPTIKCATDVPITTTGRANQGSNLTCVVDCATDGGYATKPVKTLTDCESVSTALGMLTSRRSNNITLSAGAHFYLAYVGKAWLGLGAPAVSNLEWSIVTAIDLRLRPDGFINTPPVAGIVSPQYIFVNRTSQIQIPVSDANDGDDIRCRWATFTTGSRRRRDVPAYSDPSSSTKLPTTSIVGRENILVRHVRSLLCGNSVCKSKCTYLCPCTCSSCAGTTCSGALCTSSPECPKASTTVDTPGPLLSTSTYPTRQAINECGGICFPAAIPNTTVLSNCTLSIKSLTPNVWYAAAIQIEDFIDTSSTTPMSSVPVQFLIYVMPEPDCTLAPIIMPLTGCLEVSVGVPVALNLTIVNRCDPSAVDISDLVLAKNIGGMTKGTLTSSSTNKSLSYVGLAWTPLASQIGPQQLCAVAYTEEQVQSATYCATFEVLSSTLVCVTTTTTTTTTTSTATSTSTTTSRTSTSSSTSTTSSTSSTTSSTSTTTSTSSTSSTSTSSTSTTTSETTVTTTTTSTTATAAVGAAATTNGGPSWGLIAGISSISLPLALCTFCWIYRIIGSPSAKRRRHDEQELQAWRYRHLSSQSDSLAQRSSETSGSSTIRRPSKSYQMYGVSSEEHAVHRTASTSATGASQLVTAYNNEQRQTRSLEGQDSRVQSSASGRSTPSTAIPDASPFESLSTSKISVVPLHPPSNSCTK